MSPKDIVFEVTKGSCVLIIGPDIIDYGNKSFFELLCAAIEQDESYRESLKHGPQSVMLNEELFKLRSKKDEVAIRRFMTMFYDKQTQFNDPFRIISQIPFHLIISFFADTRLKKIFEEQNFPFQYSHQPKDENPDKVDTPTKDMPVLYNILGDLSKDDNILTFDDLFNYLSGILGNHQLPAAIQEALKKAKLFIFLGIHFEKWHVQLLLKIITDQNISAKYTVLKNAEHDDLCTFVASRLDIDFIECSPIEFLQDIYQQCMHQNILKNRVTKHKKKVFISYSHDDRVIAEKIENHLTNASIHVIRDERSMWGGQKINEFISIINDVDCVILLSSENSLLSKWVIKEVSITLKQASTYFLPCYIDKSFQDKDFITKAAEMADHKFKDIASKISDRGNNSIEDLIEDRKEWIEYNQNIHAVLSDLKSRKCVSLMKDDLEKNIEIIISDILD